MTPLAAGRSFTRTARHSKISSFSRLFSETSTMATGRSTRRHASHQSSSAAESRGAARMSQSKKAAASGWIGSALEYYDFFIYATAASLVFPQLFFPVGDPVVAIAGSLATYGVGYVARPLGAFVLGHWGDTHGRKNVLLLCLFLMV